MIPLPGSMRRPTEERQLISRLLSFAAIATVADSVPLIGENRRIVKEGLKVMVTREGTTQGLYALLCALGLEAYVTAETVGFKLAPVINAPGRLKDNSSMEVLKLMLYDGPYSEAKCMAERLLEDSRERKELSDRWTEYVRQTVIERNLSGHVPIVVYEPDIPEGVIGIGGGLPIPLYPVWTVCPAGSSEGLGTFLWGDPLKKSSG